jgi:phytoene synthase
MTLPAAHIPSAAAEATLARQGRSFHWARRLLGARHAARATRLYAFCRHLDDLVDEAASPEEARAALAAADCAIEAGRSDDLALQDGLALMRECAIDPGIVRELIAGMASDAETVRVADEAELLRYCYRAAGTVGLMMCRVLDAREPAAAAHAVDLGIAMQLTNLCRDIADDARMGRRYLPASLVGDVAPAALIDPSPALQPALRAAVARLLALAESYYASGEAGLPFLPVRARTGILVAGRVYRAIGHRLAAREHAYWEGRAFVPDWRKATITLAALATQPLRGAFWSRPVAHPVSLHRALIGLPGITARHGE